MPAAKPCPVAGCTARAQRGHLMCRAHWFRVSRRTRAEVWDAWRAFENRPEGDLEETRRRIAAYRLASDAAIREAAEAR